MNLEPVTQTGLGAQILPFSSEENGSKTEVVAKRSFEAKLNIHKPDIKWWKFSTSNLTKQHGFFKYFKYIWQILKRFTDDRYLGLRNAVEAFNLNKTEVNLDKIIKHITLLRGNLMEYDDQDSLVKVTNEVILYKWKFRKETKLHFDPKQFVPTTGIASTSSSSLELLKVREALKTHKANPSEDTSKAILDELFEWMSKQPEEYAESLYSSVQKVLRELSYNIEDEEFFFQLNLLQNEAHECALRKLFKLKFQKIQGEHVLDLPSSKFHLVGRYKPLEDAIFQFNYCKNEENYKKVIDCLFRGQINASDFLTKTSITRLIKQLEKISKGITKQKEIAENEAYQFLEVLKTSPGDIVKPNTWKNLPVPKGNFWSVQNAIKLFNSDKSDNRLNAIIDAIHDWVKQDPDDFMRNGMILVRQIQTQAIKVLYLERIVIKKQLSEEHQNVIAAIRKYNTSKVFSDVPAILDALEKWNMTQKAEYDFFLGNLLKERVQGLNEKFFEVVPLPSSHPQQVLEKQLEFSCSLKTNAYIVNFHNTVAPWSHSEVVFAKQGGLAENCFQSDRYKDMLQDGAAEVQRSITCHQLLESNGFLDSNGYLKSEHLSAKSPLWDKLNQKFKSADLEYLVFLRGVLSCPIRRPFNPHSFQRVSLSKQQIEEIFEFSQTKGITFHNETRNIVPNWETRISESDLKQFEPYRDFLLFVLSETEKRETVKREYLGIGADTVYLDSESHCAEGVHIVDEKVAARMEKLCRRRKNQIQKVMNVFSGGKVGLLSFFGEMQKQLLLASDRKRHFRQALIDNLMTELNPTVFKPDFSETRYRLELYRSGGQIYEKWVEDPNGKFARVKSPSSQESSGEFIDGEYKRNNYIVEDGKLVSIRKKYMNQNPNIEWGNLVLNEDGSEEWQTDNERGQLIKDTSKGTVQKIDGPFYSALSFEKYMNGGELEWCGSYTLRMMHGAYLYEHMPEFQKTLEDLLQNLQAATNTDFKQEGVKFEKRHAKMLYTLAGQFASKVVESEAGRVYFRDMNGRIKFNPRGTPDMLQKSLEGRSPGLINSIKRAWQVIRLSEPKDFNPNWKVKLLFGAGRVLVGIIGLPFAALKLAYNVAAATLALFFDIGLAFYNGYQNRKAEIERAQEAGLEIAHPKWSLVKGTLSYGLHQGIWCRLIGDYLGLRDLVCEAKPARPAFY